MLEGLFSIISIYGISILAVHLIHGHLHRIPHKPQHEHYVLISNHNQMQIEWVIRCLWLFSWLKGIHVQITLLDQNSTDDTLPIAYKFAERLDLDIRTMQSKQELNALVHTSGLSHLYHQVITIELNNQEDLKKIPLY